MSFFAGYFHQKVKSVIMFVLFSAILFTAFLLYRLPAQALIYPIGVCGFIGIVYLLFDGIRQYKKHKKAEGIRHSPIRVTERLDGGETVYEKDLIDIIDSISNELSIQKNKADEEYENMMDYYTMWVHQIKTPIASMKLTLQNTDHPDSDGLSFDLQRIESYVEAVMCYLKLSGGSKDLMLKEYSLDAVIKRAIAEQSNGFIRKKIRLKYENCGLKAVTDEKWILFVLGQIISNSLKYTANGGTIEIFAEGKCLHIKDNGIGIEQSDLPSIFEKGYTGGNGRKERTSSGIGLYLCKMTCDMLGHGIKAVSEIDRGTDIIIDFSRKETTFE